MSSKQVTAMLHVSHSHYVESCAAQHDFVNDYLNVVAGAAACSFLVVL